MTLFPKQVGDRYPTPRQLTCFSYRGKQVKLFRMELKRKEENEQATLVMKSVSAKVITAIDFGGRGRI